MSRLLPVLSALVVSATVANAELPKSAADLFRLDQVWPVSLTLGADEWEALQPDLPESGGFFPGGPGGPGGPRGPGGPGSPGGPGPGFGPGNFLAGGVVANVDANKDGSITRTEFVAGFERWHGEWGARKQGSLTAEEIRDGFNKSLGGPPPGPGGPGGFGLQGREGMRNGLSAMRGINFEYVRANFGFDGTPFTNIAIRYKGNGTFMDARNTEKKSLKIDLNEFVKGQKIAGVSKLNLHNNISDPSWMREALAYQLYRAAGVPAPRTSWATVTLSAGSAHTNRFLGLYSLVENPDNNWAEDNFGSKKGAILKPVTRELFKFQGTDWATYNQAYDPKTELTLSQQQRIYDFARLVTDADDAEFARRLPEFLDIDEFSRFMAVTVWLSSTDSILMMGQNFVVYLHPKSNRFHFVPWDLDRAFGNFFGAPPDQLSIRQAWGEDNRFLNRVMKVEAVRTAYLDRMKEFQSSIFQPAKIDQMVDQVAALIRPAVEREGEDVLRRFDQFVGGKAVDPEQGGPGMRFGMGSGKPVKVFVQERYQSVADQLAGKSEGVALGSGPGGGRGPGGRGGGMRNFGPGMILGPAFVKAADADTNGQVTSKEFSALAERWFVEWDKEKTGTLKQSDVAAGLNAVLPMPNFGGPPPP